MHDARPVRERLVTIALYGGALAVVGIWLYATHPEETRAVLHRLAHCAGCQRRRDMIARMMHQAQEAVTDA